MARGLYLRALAAVYDATMQYWAAKGTAMLGVRAVLAESYERIHRSNLIGMGVLPLEFVDGQSVESLGLTARESYDITGLDGLADDQPLPEHLRVRADSTFQARLRVDTATAASCSSCCASSPTAVRQRHSVS